ncbi:hypothetical protein [Streptomyces sp. 6N106]
MRVRTRRISLTEWEFITYNDRREVISTVRMTRDRARALGLI